jgi:hypothetical protein
MLPIAPAREPRTAPARAPHVRPAAARAKPVEPDAADPAFDQMLAERAELERETNAINELGAQQAKRDDQLMREWIKMI